MANLSGSFGHIAPVFRQSRGIVLMAVAVLLIPALASWHFLPRWLPKLAQRWLPADVRLTIGPSSGQGPDGWRLPDWSLNRGDCAWISVSGLTVRHPADQWRFDAQRVRVDSACAPVFAARADLSWRRIFAFMPAFSAHIGRLEVAPWQQYAGEVQLASARANVLRLSFRNSRIAADMQLQDRQLNIEQLVLRRSPARAPWRLQGRLQLSSQIFAPPEQGEVTAALSLADDQPFGVKLLWRQRQGELQINDRQSPVALARLPWRLDNGVLVVEQGIWRWPRAIAPLTGDIALRVQDWRWQTRDLAIVARLNMQSRGKRGKADVVLNVGPGRLGLDDNALDVRLTGTANQGRLSLAAAIPGRLQGSLADPALRMLPGALLQVLGPVAEALNITRARVPLAGVVLTSRGFSGRLQAILSASSAKMGHFTLHLDGHAQDFLPDRGQWRWRYWGDGVVPLFKARWRMAGQGGWLSNIIEVSRLNGAFDQLQYGLLQVTAPRLTLLSPLRWRRFAAQPALSGDIRLDASRVDITRGGFLLRPTLAVQLTGRGPQDLLWRGQLRAGAAGPVRLNGRWDGRRWRGQAWWPRQSVRVLQTLLQPSLQILLNSGEFHAQSAFSAAARQGFLAGGHAVVSGGDAWLGDHRLQGIALGLSYRLQDQRWQLGVRAPVRLDIDTIQTPVVLRHLAMRLQGYYPYDRHRPLTLTQADVDALGGHIRLSPLSMPQREAAVLSLNAIDMSALLAALKIRQFSLSGKVSGELPLQFADPRGYIRHGWLANDHFLTLRLDKQFADEIGRRNLASSAAISLLRYMEISHSRADLDVDLAGNMSLSARIYGSSPQDDGRREVRLNYRQQENLFQLWRSLRFGTQVEQILEQQTVAPDGSRGKQQ